MEVLILFLAVLCPLALIHAVYLHLKASDITKKYIELQTKLTDWQDRPKSVELEEFLADLLTEGQAVIRLQPIAVRDILLRAQNTEKGKL